jgi:hypothetical protein
MTERDALLDEIDALLQQMEKDAYDRFNAEMEALGAAAANPFASQHCEIPRIEAHAYRKARAAIMGRFAKSEDAP